MTAAIADPANAPAFPPADPPGRSPDGAPWATDAKEPVVGDWIVADGTHRKVASVGPRWVQFDGSTRPNRYDRQTLRLDAAQTGAGRMVETRVRELQLKRDTRIRETLGSFGIYQDHAERHVLEAVAGAIHAIRPVT